MSYLLYVFLVVPLLTSTAGGGSGEMMGEDHKSHLMNSLFGCRWDPSCVLHVTDMCKDIAMSEDELKFLIQKILQYAH